MRKIKFVLLSAGILLGVFWTLVGIGPRAAGDFPFGYRDYVKDGFSLPQTWSARGNGLGGPNISVLWGWPLDFLYGLGAKVGIDFSILFRLLAIIPIFALGLWGIRRLLRLYKIKPVGIFVGSLFYLLNTYLTLLIDGGQLSIALAYSWFPTAFLSVKSSTEKGLRGKLVAGFVVSILALFDIRFVYLLIFLLAIQFIYQIVFASGERRSKLLFSWLLSAIVVILVLIGLNVYWIFPALLSRVSVIPAGYQNVAQTLFLNFTTLGHSLTLLQPHWYLNVFGKVTPLLWEFFLIPILVFLAPVLRKKDKTVAFWLLIALISVFLAKGANSPLPQIYTWLFIHLPGFSLFRDSTKFFFLVALSYAVLIGITTDEIIKRMGKRALIVLILFAAYFILLVRPVWLGKMTGIFSNPPYQKEYSVLARKLETGKDFGRILWIPTISPLGYSSPTHPALDASRLTALRPFASAVTGTYETFNFLRAPYIQYLLDIAGIKYIVYPYPDIRREVLKQDNIDYYHWFLAKIADSSWGQIAGDLGGKNSPVPVVEVNKHEDRFFLIPSTWWIIGSDRIYGDLAKLPDLDLSKNALVFAEEHPGLSQRLKEFPNAQLLIYGKNDTDLAGNFLDASSLIFPAKNLDFSPDKTGWWKRETADLISWRGFLQEKYAIDNQDFDLGGGWAVGEGNVKLQISNDKLKKGNILLVRVMESAKGGKIEFYQGNNLVGVVSTKLEPPRDDANMRWFEVGNLNSDAPVEIKTFGDINVVNALASVSVSEWSRINESIHQYQIVEWDKLTDKEKKSLFKSADVPTVNYQRVNSTHYEVEVKGIKGSAVLAFSETYDPLWQMNGKESFPLYSLINGFQIDKDGTYDIYFTPQRYVVPGLIVSAIAFFSLGAFFVISKKRKEEL